MHTAVLSKELLPMQTVTTGALELVPVSFGAPGARVDVSFPLNRWTGTADSGVVYFEIAPGDHLATHTDSAEEVLYIVTGTGEAECGDERGVVTAGDLAVIPAMVPHGIRNIGDERLRVVGFFSESRIVSTFEEPVQPIGLATMEQGAPVPA
jgi:mannose-6-phosphate isomerase-like protein (cupin superfamily)